MENANPENDARACPRVYCRADTREEWTSLGRHYLGILKRERRAVVDSPWNMDFFNLLAAIYCLAEGRGTQSHKELRIDPTTWLFYVNNETDPRPNN